MKKIFGILSLGAITLVPGLALAATSVGISVGLGGNWLGFPGGGMGGDIGGIAYTILGIINGILVPLLFAVAFIVFLYGVAKAYIFSNGEPAEVGKGHKLILWGVIGFVAMISVWGLVNVVANTFGLGGIAGPPPLPRSY